MVQGVTLTNPDNQVSTTTAPVDLQIQAVTSHPGATLTYQATALPAGLTLGYASSPTRRAGPSRTTR
ncbi:hypothetical protein OS965_14780 [Streptomyces sp. H27-G5]|uniref:hypothetical protein n=1 Tax=Streptomyces sp. H27-G5 TaxID=2996698 RepID=UPI00226DD0B2|nr:hypothetical protein [Streptomyces sp. H27-G5]MCY0919436.1 hypothetical protein [Streptomyces sp. H27-G5]